MRSADRNRSVGGPPEKGDKSQDKRVFVAASFCQVSNLAKMEKISLDISSQRIDNNFYSCRAAGRWLLSEFYCRNIFWRYLCLL
ncbi:hypothetical protein KL86SPO_30881 [uncultured Sporomusa sp.]|uniref:Uncharacterized protein n=1 Tax=uncultured Sporomusa sp. TaxID=307249 RepID=A0A212LSZ7_9FIRM|nr:hypothetical protein KL86SPO_30881 [uncultured Sporomusa sp.]